MIKNLFVAAVAALAVAGVAEAADLTPLDPAQKPLRMSGVGLTVSDLERSKQFYTEVLGFKVAARVPAQGPVVEYLLGLTGDLRADGLVVLRQGKVEPGATKFGRIVVVAPNGRALAERAAQAGFPPAKIVDGTNIVRDPDGYTIELYQRPAPR